MNIDVAISNAGLGSPQVIHDGKIHRFTADDDKPHSNSCWYVSFGGAGAFGSWKLGFTETWHQQNDRSKDDDAALAKQIMAAKKQRQDELTASQNHAKDSAQILWNKGTEDINHPYIDAKHIQPYGIRQNGDMLLIPMYYQGELWNVQKIHASGAKLFMKGGRVSGCYMAIGKLSGHLIISEGYATGASLHEHAGVAVAVAFTAGNLSHVALAMRVKYPNLKITIAADNDVNTPGNPGKTKAKEAAGLIQAYFMCPRFDDEPFEGTDYNDYLTQGGKLCHL